MCASVGTHQYLKVKPIGREFSVEISGITLKHLQELKKKYGLKTNADIIRLAINGFYYLNREEPKPESLLNRLTKVR